MGRIVALLYCAVFPGISRVLDVDVFGITLILRTFGLFFQSDYSGWLDRPLAANYWKVAEAETKHLVPLYKVQQDRINAKCALLINTRLTQFQKHKVSGEARVFYLNFTCFSTVFTCF